VPALNTRASKQSHSSFLAWLREQKFFLDLKWMLPASFTRKLKPLLRKPIAVEITWTEETRRMVVERLNAELPQFLKRYGKPADHWKLD
jgi:hypothetical protein